MLKKERQIHYLTKRWKLMMIHLNAFEKTKKVEDLHLLRVEIKKIFALVYLQTHCGNNFDPKVLKPLKKVFSHAGKVRNTHVAVLLIKQFKYDKTVYADTLNKTLTNLTKEFLFAIPVYKKDLGSFLFEFQKNIHPLKKINLLDFFENKLTQLGNVFSKTSFTKKLHKSRKKIKRLLYIHQLINKSAKKKIHLNEAYLHELQDVIGKWHDTMVAKNFLTEAGSPKISPMKKLQDQSKELYKSCQILSKGFLIKTLSDTI